MVSEPLNSLDTYRRSQAGFAPLARAALLAAITLLAAPATGLAQTVDAAKRCLELTTPKAGGGRPEVVASFELLMIDVPFEALAVCRRALAAAPADAGLIAGEDLATKVVSTLALGVDYPPKRADAVAKALALAPGATGIEAPLIAYYLGSAFAYGAGIPKDPAGAILWFTKALQAKTQGDDVVQSELYRVRAALAPK